MLSSSVCSNTVSPAMFTVIVAVDCPASKKTPPCGITPPTKSCASVLGTTPKLLKVVHETEDVPERSPVRVTVKVNGVEPELPS